MLSQEMPEDFLVRVENVSKKFCKRLRDIMWYGIQDLSRELIRSNSNHMSRQAQLRKGEFWALQNISFELKPGECIGVIGGNGAGKTTLLKLIDGILRPDEGRIKICGRVGALIELGAGFHPMLSGRENIYVNASMLGMSRADIDKKFDSIVDFAGIGDFLDAPVKTYSSGMSVRLGFSIAIHTEPDILLIDEVLAVGDAAFQRKCQNRISELLEAGAGLILVSHNMTIVQHLATRVLLLTKGHSDLGTFTEVYPRYLEHSLELPEERKQTVVRAAAVSPEVERQTGEIEIQSIEWTPGPVSVGDTFRSGDSLIVNVKYESKIPVAAPVYSVGFYRDDGVLCFSERSTAADLKPGLNHFKVIFQSLYLRPGIYTMEIAINDAMVVVPLGRKRSAWFKIIDSDSVGSIRVHAPVYRQACEWEWK